MIGLMLCSASLSLAVLIVVFVSRFTPDRKKYRLLFATWCFVAYFVVFLPAGGMALTLSTGVFNAVRDDGITPREQTKRLTSAFCTVGCAFAVTGVLLLLERYERRNTLPKRPRQERP